MAKILVVDDEHAILDIINTLLTEVGHTPSLANSGKSALEFLSNGKEPYELVLLDLSMPDMSGIEVLESLKERNIVIPKVIILTGMMEIDLYVRAKQLGASEYITKPFDFDTFLAIIENYLKTS